MRSGRDAERPVSEAAARPRRSSLPGEPRPRHPRRHGIAPLLTALPALALLVVGAGLGGVGLQDPSGDGGRRTGSFERERHRMVVEQIRGRGLDDPRILAAMEAVPRHLFVPEAYRDEAYEDHPLPIGHGQTISQPYVVALMSALLDLQPGDRVLEIGTGSAYHAAVLSHLAARVYTIEIVEELARRAEETLEKLGYDNVHVRSGDGYQGWPEAAPFDAVLLTAAPREIPRPLLDQLAVGGRLVAPVGGRLQRLQVITRTEEGLVTELRDPVQFVPMTGEAEKGGGAPLPD